MFNKEDLLEFSLFDPKKDQPIKIIDCPGNYVVLLRKGSKLPDGGTSYVPIIVNYDGNEYEVIYVGLSTKSLRKRDYKQHFTGNAGRSTLRKSLGSLMGLKKTWRDKPKDGEQSSKTKFIDEDEDRLSQWMEENLLMLYKANGHSEVLETEMIQVLNPPLNLEKNTNTVNLSFRMNLKKLRTDKSNIE